MKLPASEFFPRVNKLISEDWQQIYTVFRKKHPLMFSIITPVFLGRFLYVPVEREMNTLQFSYLQSWWCHNCVTLHATKVCFIELLLNIKYIEFEDKIVIKNLWKCKDFLPEDWQKILYKKWKDMMAFCESCKQRVRSNALQEAVGHGRLKMWCFTLGSVETQLGWCCKFCWFFVKYSFLFPLVQKV